MSVEVKNLSVTIEQLPILSNLNFTIAPGEFVSIVGPSGSGKSTLFKALTGVVPVTSGEILIAETKVTGLNQQFNYMPQDDILFEWYDVFHNVTLSQKIKGETIDEAKVTAMLKRFGLFEYRHFLPSQLSGGMRQRVALLRTVLGSADYLLLDEPFGSLDAMTRSLMQDWFIEVARDLNRTTLLVTHDIEEAIYLSDRILVFSARPAEIMQEFKLQPTKRNRQWLNQMSGLKDEIYQLLRGETHVN